MHEPVAPEPVTIAHRTDDDARTPVDAARLVAGQPLQAVANAYSSADDAFHCGIWEGDAGAWRVRYTEYELCHMLAGRQGAHHRRGRRGPRIRGRGEFRHPCRFQRGVGGAGAGTQAVCGLRTGDRRSHALTRCGLTAVDGGS